LPKACEAIIVKSVLFELAKVASKFYPNSDLDYPDNSLKKPNKSKFPGVKFGNNVLIGKNVKIGKSSVIGSNTIIESNVLIGKNCLIGSQVMIKNSVIGNDVVIQDGSKIGLKGFGFIPIKDKNFRIPHIGKVILKDNVEIGASCTIDRGSIGDTVIGKNTFLDNQVHMAHNVKVGENCMIAGQVGFAGSSTLGNNVSIGGQAGISGHLKIGNNVKIGGGSGVVKDIPDDTIVMGYPAVPLKEFLKKN
jgi:UDP-3-O-[3-hydroxymyristoyl] glucosamine N-acyltransferase